MKWACLPFPCWCGKQGRADGRRQGRADGSICRQWSPGLGTLLPSSSCLFMRFDLGSHSLPLSRNPFQWPEQSLGHLGIIPGAPVREVSFEAFVRLTSLRKLPLATLVLGLLSSLNSHGAHVCFPAPDCGMYGGGLSVIAGSLLHDLIVNCAQGFLASLHGVSQVQGPIPALDQCSLM